LESKKNGRDKNLKSMQYCFACGKKNPRGLKLTFTFDGKFAESVFTPHIYHQGWSNILHGGLIATLLDEAMVYAAYFAGIKAVTGELRVRFHREAAVGGRLRIRGWIEGSRLGLFFARAHIFNEKGELMAEGEGKLVREKGD